MFKREGSRPVAIFGEVKGSVTNFTQVLKEMGERRKVIESNLDHIKTHYLDTRSDPILEYVLAIKSSLSTKMRDTILEGPERAILWQVDYMHHQLSLVQAPRQQPDRRMMTHGDSELTRILGSGDGVSSYENTFAFYPQSHILAKLLAMLPVIDIEGANVILRPFKLAQYVGAQLSYLDEGARQREVDSIVSEAEKVGFAVKTRESPDLLIPSRSRARASLETELRRRWMKTRVEERWLGALEDARSSLQASIMEKQKMQPTLFPEEDDAGAH